MFAAAETGQRARSISQHIPLRRTRQFRFSAHPRRSRASAQQHVDRRNDHAFDLATLVVWPVTISCLPAWADGEGASAYNPAAQSEFITTFAGVLYCGLVAYFLFRLFKRRAARFTSERIGSQGESASTQPPAPEDPELVEPPAVTPLQTAITAAQALAIAAALWFASEKVNYFLGQAPVPEQYAARNVSLTVRTIIVGLTYLATFVFAANGLGLSALTLKLLIFGDDPAAAQKPAAPESLPKISLTSDIEDVMKAFDEAERPARRPETRD